MTTLVTGATGFVGSAVARQLLAAGHTVRVLVRPGAVTDNLEGLDVQRITGALDDSPSLVNAVVGCEALFHVAADYRLWVPDPSVMYRANVDGTRALLTAAADAGVSRMVYTSSVATLGRHHDGTPADETTPSRLAHMIGPYKRSKYLAEQAVQELADRDGLPVVIVNPSTPIGPRDVKPTPTGRIIVDAASGRIPAYMDTGLNVVHVDDVATGHLMAFDRGKVGTRYVLGAENMSLRAILAAVAERCGRRPPRIRLPYGLVLPMAHAMEAWSRLTHGGEPRATVDAVRMARHTMYFESTRAQSNLGYRPRPAGEAIADALDWFRDAGYCP